MHTARRVFVFVTAAVCLAVAGIASVVLAVSVAAAGLLPQPAPIASLLPSPIDHQSTLATTTAIPSAPAPARPHRQRGCRGGRQRRPALTPTAARTAGLRPPSTGAASDASTQTPLFLPQFTHSRLPYAGARKFTTRTLVNAQLPYHPPTPVSARNEPRVAPSRHHALMLLAKCPCK
eukprot:646600-Pleurochrysis_carterae.AAC.1